MYARGKPIMSVLLLTLVAAALGQTVTCPQWTLPWGTYPGVVANKFCVYSDVRFAGPATGKSRFAAPVYPPPKGSPEAPGQQMSCIQASGSNGAGELLPPKLPGDNADYYGTQNEDCLFLDVYIPPAAFTTKTPIPVVVWQFGGAYMFGSKTAFDPSIAPFYEGTGPINTTSTNGDGPVIFVAGNYRLGAFGWLAGQLMAGQQGQPNAGLLDQRAVLRFVNDYLETINGTTHRLNLGTISLWGESAGASSIMHQLAMPLNVEKPLFQRAVLQSPAFQWMWDNDLLDQAYTNFSLLVTTNLPGACYKSTNIECLRNADTSLLQNANSLFADTVVTRGVFPVGPSVDGNLVPALAPTRFNSTVIGPRKVMALQSIIVSHVAQEVQPDMNAADSSFIPFEIRNNPYNEDVFVGFVQEIFPPKRYPNQLAAILKQYPSPSDKNQVVRAAKLIQDSTFLCNTRFIIDYYLAQKTPTYAMDYAVGEEFGAAVHASDLLPLFALSSTDYAAFLQERKPGLPKGVAEKLSHFIVNNIAPGMQTYFTSHAATGDPNHYSRKPAFSI